MSVVENEPVAPQGVEPGADPAAVGAGAPGADEPLAPAAEPAAPSSTPEIPWDSRDFWAEVGQRLQAEGYTVSQAQAQEPQPAPQQPQFVDAYGQFDQTAFERYQADREAKLVEQVRAEFAPTAEYARAQQEQFVNDMIDNRIELAITAAELPTDGFESAQHLHRVVNAVANQIAADRISSLGRQPYGSEAQRIGEESIADAVKSLKAYGDARSAAGVEAYKQSFSTDGGRGNFLEPGIRSAGVEGTPGYASEMDVARRWISGNQS